MFGEEILGADVNINQENRMKEMSIQEVYVEDVDEYLWWCDSPASDKDILRITLHIFSIESMMDKLFKYSEDWHEEILAKVEPKKKVRNLTELLVYLLFIIKKVLLFAMAIKIGNTDGILQLANVVVSNTKKAQVFDELQVEKEREITVKVQICSIVYDGYLVDPIDTLGHVDFSFETARKFTRM
uniref:Tr-type G domain-containing protein n=1 Tax=Strongyloides papillosus TaxID=174720 RepID=A0A0N5C5I5_STREA